MKKALLIGDYIGAPYHPLKDVDEAVKGILKNQFEVTVTDRYEDLEGNRLDGYDLLLIYNDKWGQLIEQSQVAGILTFVATGGGIVVLHSGMSLQDHPEMVHLYGAKFTGHPEFQELTFELSGEHEITKGLEGFTMGEEPYMYAWSPFIKTDVIMSYSFDGEQKPAGWAHEYGLGKFVQLMPGHTAKAFEVEAYQKVIQRACKWASK